MRTLKSTRRVTYRRSWGNGYGQVPCIILEGGWLTEKYGVKYGDNVGVKFKKREIVLEMIPGPKVAWEYCKKCGRRLKRRVSERQSAFIKEERVCGNCANSLKSQRVKSVIMKLQGQDSLFERGKK